MAYVEPNFKTKKALREALAAGKTVVAYQPGGIFPLKTECVLSVEGPHYPEPHRWYARVYVNAESIVTKVLS